MKNRNSIGKMVWAMLLAALFVTVTDVHAQSTDARYPMGVWQTDDEDEAASKSKYYLYMVISRGSSEDEAYGNRVGCGTLEISEKGTNKELYSGILSYVGKKVDNHVPTGIYFFDVTDKDGNTCSLSIDGGRTPMITASGKLKDHPALKDKLVLCRGAFAGSGGGEVAMWHETEQNLLDDLRACVKDSRLEAHGFGDLRLYINAHARLDPSKPKYLKPKGTSAVNIRSKADTKAEKIAELNPGETLLVCEELDGWCAVDLGDDLWGYVSLSVVTLTNTPGKQAACYLETYPLSVNGHLAFLGIPLNESPLVMRDKLMAMGMKKAVGMENDTHNIYLSGSVERKPCVICITVGEDNKIFNVLCTEKERYTLQEARSRVNKLAKRVRNNSGEKGKRNFSDNSGEFNFFFDEGAINISYFNENEEEGSSPIFKVATVYTISK